MKRIYNLFFVGLLASLSICATAQTTVTLNPAKDNVLFEDAAGGLSNGVGNELITGQTNNGLVRRSVIQFDLSSIPADAVIEAVSLTLSTARVQNGSRTIGIHTVTQDWGEGTSNSGNGRGNIATNGDATWIHAFNPDVRWSNSGGDFEGTPSATVQASAGDVVWSTDQMVADVQTWVSDATQNFGWILIGDESENKSTLHFQSREGNSQPELSVTYSVEAASTANVQIIHNAADPAAAAVDIYINGSLELDDFEFRKATPFIPLPANETIQVAVAPGNSSSVENAIATFPFTLEPDENYIIMASGVLNPAQFDQRVNDDIGFNLFVLNPARQAAVGGATAVDLTSFHGATDAPIVDVVVPALAGITIIDDLTYGQFTEYSSLPFVPTTLIELDVITDADRALVGTFASNLSSYTGQAITIFASGFAAPANNQDGAALGIFIATPSGEVFEAENTTTSLLKIEPLEGVNIFPNPIRDVVNIAATTLGNQPVQIEVFDMQGKLMTAKQVNPNAGSFNETLDLSNLAAANYTIKVTQADKVSVEKIVKK